MDDIQFDALTRAIGVQITRRLTVSALLGGALGLRDAGESQGKRKGKRTSRTCKPVCPECTTCTQSTCTKKNGKKRCKKRTCQPKQEGTPCSVPTGGTCENGVCACPEHLSNVGGACGCPAGLTNCAGVCTTLETDAANCGACGTTCGAARTCCSGVCRNLNVDGANCGACGHACATNLCVHGACDCQFLAMNCPAGCSCGVRAEGGTVCFDGFIGQACTVDAECPFRSSCLGNNFCSLPCLV